MRRRNLLMVALLVFQGKIGLFSWLLLADLNLLQIRSRYNPTRTKFDIPISHEECGAIGPFYPTGGKRLTTEAREMALRITGTYVGSFFWSKTTATPLERSYFSTYSFFQFLF